MLTLSRGWLILRLAGVVLKTRGVNSRAGPGYGDLGVLAYVWAPRL